MRILLLIVVCTLAAAGGCAGPIQERPLAMPPAPAHISHPVFIKLNDPARADELIHDCNVMLTQIPSVVSYAVGRHLDTGRDTVDGDYDVALYVGFDSLEGYAEYVDHPLHVELVRKWRPHWLWIRVHDFQDETPR